MPRRALYDEAMAMQATIELDAGAKTFASGLLPELIDALRRSRPGDLLALTSDAERVSAPSFETWCRFTAQQPGRNDASRLVRTRWVVRYGEAPGG